MLASLFRFLDRLDRIITVATAVLMAILAVTVCWQVFARYVLMESPYWVEEFSVTAMMWIGLLGAAACVWTGDHMSLELIVRRLPKALKVWVEILTDVAIGLFAGFLCVQGWVLTAETMDSEMSTIPLPLGVTYMVLPVAGALMIVFAFSRAIRKTAAYFGPQQEKGESRDA